MKCIENEIPFEVPEGWAWCRLKHVCTMAAGKAKPTDQIMTEPFEGCYPCFGGNGIRGYVDEYNQDGIFSIVGRQGALCGNINIAKGKFYATEHAVVTTLFSGIDFNWSNYVLEALQLNSYATGAAQPGLSVANVLNVFVPVPPTQEQVHIGIRIAESIKIIENIEDEKENLQTLISSAKSKILDLAIRGKLVSQNPNDEPASVLLERIRAEKEELIKQGKIKRDKKESIIFKGEDNSYYEKIGNEVTCIDGEMPFEIPEMWVWSRLGSLGIWGAGATPSRNIPEYYNGNIPWLKTGDLNDDYITYIPENISELALTNTSVRINPKGSVLIAMYGATIGKLGILTFPATTNQACCACIPFAGMENRYLFYYLLSQRENFIYRGVGGAQLNISKEKIVSTLIPLPPQNAQVKILEKIDRLFNLLSTVEQSLN